MKYLFMTVCVGLCAWRCQQDARKLGPAIVEVAARPQSTDTLICPDGMPENESDTIPFNLFSPKNRDDVCGWWMPEDTVTPKGNFVKYLISNDTCCRSYLYLKWGNNRFENTGNVGGFRHFNPRMTPAYIAESDQYLFLESAASGGMPSTGWNLWVLPLVPGLKSAVYTTISNQAYDLRSLTIVREIYDAPGDYPLLEAYNIRTHQIKPIKLRHRISAASASWAIDSVSITPQHIFLRIGVLNDQDDMVDETIVLPNDIK